MVIVGVVGKPNVGKSTFFKALTLSNAESGNFPFTTINPNFGVGFVKVEDPARFFGKTSNPREGFVLGKWRFLPVQVVDVAGLVPGAHEGKGLGNKFLDDLRQADALIHIIDLSGSTNEKGEPVPLNSYDPKNDIKFLENEIDYWYLKILKKNWDNILKKMKFSDLKLSEAIAIPLTGLNIKEDKIDETLKELSLDKTNIENNDNLFKFVRLLRKKTKPIIIGANKVDVLLKNNLWKEKLERLKEEFKDYIIIPISSNYEWNLKKAAEKNIIKYIPGENNFEIINENLSPQQIEGLNLIKRYLEIVGDTGVQKLIDKTLFELLKMKPIFPGGSKLEDKDGNVIPDSFIMDEKATALDFAYKLHTDFGKNFIKAIDVKTKKNIGKDYILKFGDVIEIISGK